ncbi:MAG TPA: peptidase S41, partial [Porphyromonadaceae bacterium]|nr:peptidase S41 [Porphyromonadaceae bacterium]
PYYIQESSELIESQLEALIVRNFFGEEAFYLAFLKKDPLIRKAIQLIETGKATPVAVVKGEYV